MPILPPSNAAPPYDSIDVVLNFARVIANDCQLSLAGNLLSDAQPYTLTTLNLAWRKLQDRLGNNNIEEFPQEVVLSNITAMPAAVVTDPGTQAYIDFSNYFDGSVLNVAPVLPQDLEIPLKLWERPSGQNAQFIEMYPVSDALPSRAKSISFREWEWRDDKIYLVGATQKNDIRIRYKRFLADLALVQGVGGNPIPILRCAVALAYLTVEIFSTGRMGSALGKFTAEKEEAIIQLINSTTRKRQRISFRRQGYSRRGGRIN